MVLSARAHARRHFSGDTQPQAACAQASEPALACAHHAHVRAPPMLALHGAFPLLELAAMHPTAHVLLLLLHELLVLLMVRVAVALPAPCPAGWGRRRGRRRRRRLLLLEAAKLGRVDLQAGGGEEGGGQGCVSRYKGDISEQWQPPGSAARTGPAPWPMA